MSMPNRLSQAQILDDMAIAGSIVTDIGFTEFL
jgi:hypothetical protein